jgi:hypothetical protein
MDPKPNLEADNATTLWEFSDVEGDGGGETPRAGTLW